MQRSVPSIRTSPSVPLSDTERGKTRGHGRQDSAAADLAASESPVAWRHLAFVRLAAPPVGRDDPRYDAWLEACYRLTMRVETLPPGGVLLDLGDCTDTEALRAMRGLLRRLVALGGQPRAGIASTAALARLATLTAPARTSLALVTREAAPAFLRALPVAALAQLYPEDALPTEALERLRQYGLATLAQVARLGVPALRRQFGAAGDVLAAIVAGGDEQPLHPTPPAPRLRFRLRFASPVRVGRVAEALPRWSVRVAAELRRRERCVRELRLSLRWESGSIQGARLSLRTYSDDPAVLALALQRLFTTLLALVPGAERRGAIEEVRLIARDFAPAHPAQTTFWRTPEQRHHAADHVAETLARRHGHPLLLRLQLAAPAAVFAEERYRLAALAPTEPLTPARGPARTAPRRAPRVPAGGAAEDPWQQVPHRLHWW
jgi:hypothetical protein